MIEENREKIVNESPCSKLQGIKAELIISPHSNPLPKLREHKGITLYQATGN
jgi:hypothetical protein